MLMRQAFVMIVKFALTAAAVYALVVAGAYLLQRQLMYHPDRTRVAPVVLGLDGVEEVVLQRPAGVDLIAWFAAPQDGRPTIVFFHGNAGSVASRAARVAYWAGRGHGVFFMNYRGYGGSGGSPSEADNVADAIAALDYLAERGIAAERTVVYGESLGSSVAVQVAAQRPVAAVVLEAPFTSATDVAAGVYPFLPVRLLLKDRYNSMALIEDIDVPLLIVHGRGDRIVPFAHGERLFARAREPKTFFAVPDAAHNDLDRPDIRERVAAFLAETVGE